jgi:hypothetical protein
VIVDRTGEASKHAVQGDTGVEGPAGAQAGNAHAAGVMADESSLPPVDDGVAIEGCRGQSVGHGGGIGQSRGRRGGWPAGRD